MWRHKWNKICRLGCVLKKNTTELSNIQFSWVVRVFLVAISECSGYQFKHNEHDNLTEALKKFKIISMLSF